jgi:hypothetical protein
MAKLNNLVAIAIIALLSLSVFAASSGAMGDLNLHTVQVNLTGSMQLGWYVQTESITIQQNFTARVPENITAGTYKATFQGFARIDKDNIDFSGAIATENGTFMAEFDVPNTYTLPLGFCGATGQLVLVISETSLPPPFAYEWIRLVGHVTNYGNSPAAGCLQANVKIANSTIGTCENVSRVHVTWIPLGSVPPTSTLWHPWNITGNFTYSYYSATLINATTTTLNYSGNDLYISGLWTVLNVTWTFSGINWNDFQTSTSYVRQNATGQLEVYGGWKNFTLSITGFDDVKGSVVLLAIRAATFLEGDVLGHGTVDIYDLVYVARYIGAVPGDPRWGGLSNFESVAKADVNNEGCVNIYDLVTVAAQMGQHG